MLLVLLVLLVLGTTSTISASSTASTTGTTSTTSTTRVYPGFLACRDLLHDNTCAFEVHVDTDKSKTWAYLGIYKLKRAPFRELLVASMYIHMYA
jgi:hypothetical protein